jgi:hypothetical protein
MNVASMSDQRVSLLTGSRKWMGSVDMGLVGRHATRSGVMPATVSRSARRSSRSS